MDTQKTGKFLADLRKERNLTQEQLGEIVGATNKTVSRWETGIYMPPVEALEILSREFGVTINEIVAGERLSDEKFKEKAEENLANAWRDSAFTLEERRKFFSDKWEREHIPDKIIVTIVCIAMLIAGEIWLRPLVIAAVLIAIGFSIYSNNKKAAYVERKAFWENKKDD